jgi:hypothetical protein
LDSNKIEQNCMSPLKEPAHTRKIDSETHARVVEEGCCGRIAILSIEPSWTMRRRWKTTVSADSFDPGFAAVRNRMNNEVIELLLSKSDHALDSDGRLNSSTFAIIGHYSGFF